jgi:hypothetical protein
MRRRMWRVILAAVAAAALLGWYVGRPETDDMFLVIPVATYTPGTVRLDQGVWVSRQPDGAFMVFQDRDPHRGQRLNWVEARGLFMQAAIYRADGSCETGPCGLGLFRVEARLEGETLVVYPGRVISGGLDPTPAWVSDLRHWLWPARPAAPAATRP